jgi:hypothetical protein
VSRLFKVSDGKDSTGVSGASGKATVDGTDVIDRTDFVGAGCTAFSWLL